MRIEADRQTIYAEIEAERRRQDERWGGPAHDDVLVTGDWFRLIRAQINRFHIDVGAGRDERTTASERLTTIAALAVAARERLQRRSG